MIYHDNDQGADVDDPDDDLGEEPTEPIYTTSLRKVLNPRPRSGAEPPLRHPYAPPIEPQK